MRFKKFEFTNFRGIKQTTIDLTRNPYTNINVLVGLNESGKTTILEAMFHFLSNPNLLKAAPSANVRTFADYQAMLPISKRALFNGTVQIKATVEIEPGDWGKIDGFMSKTFGFIESKQVAQFSIAHQVLFEDSKYKKTTNLWGILNRPGFRGGQLV